MGRVVMARDLSAVLNLSYPHRTEHWVYLDSPGCLLLMSSPDRVRVATIKHPDDLFSAATAAGIQVHCHYTHLLRGAQSLQNSKLGLKKYIVMKGREDFFFPFSVSRNLSPLQIFLIGLATPFANHLKLPAAF